MYNRMNKLQQEVLLFHIRFHPHLHGLNMLLDFSMNWFRTKYEVVLISQLLFYYDTFLREIPLGC